MRTYAPAEPGAVLDALLEEPSLARGVGGLTAGYAKDARRVPLPIGSVPDTFTVPAPAGATTVAVPALAQATRRRSEGTAQAARERTLGGSLPRPRHERKAS